MVNGICTLLVKPSNIYLSPQPIAQFLTEVEQFVVNNNLL